MGYGSWCVGYWVLCGVRCMVYAVEGIMVYGVECSVYVVWGVVYDAK